MKKPYHIVTPMLLCINLMATMIHTIKDCPTVSALNHHQVVTSDVQIRWDGAQKAHQINVTETHVRLKDARGHTSLWVLLASFPIRSSAFFLSLDEIKSKAQGIYTWLSVQPKMRVDVYGGYRQCVYPIDGQKRFIIAEPL